MEISKCLVMTRFKQVFSSVNHEPFYFCSHSAKLENCILSAGSIVDEKCNMKDCDVAVNVRVPAGTNTKGEKFDE